MLPPGAPGRARLIEDLAESRLVIGELGAAVSTLEELASEAPSGTPLAAWAELRRDEVSFFTDPRGTSVDELRERATSVAGALERAGDGAHLAAVLEFLAVLAWLSGSAEEMVATAERALDLGRSAGNRRTVAVAAGYVGRGLQLGPTPLDEVLARLTDLMSELVEDRVAQAACRLERAVTLAMLERPNDAASDVASAVEVLEELGQHRWLAAASGVAGLTLWASGDPEAAEGKLRSGYTFFHNQGDVANATPAACDLAHVLCDLGRFGEAARLADEVAAAAGEYDLEPQIGWRTAHARARSAAGDHDGAARLIDEASALASATDFLGLQGDTELYRAQVRFAAGRNDEARAAIEAAAALYGRKGDLAELAATRRFAEAWRRAAPVDS
jgi:tetratricopeptide (TPR) repeat protein